VHEIPQLGGNNRDASFLWRSRQHRFSLTPFRRDKGHSQSGKTKRGGIFPHSGFEKLFQTNFFPSLFLQSLLLSAMRTEYHRLLAKSTSFSKDCPTAFFLICSWTMKLQINPRGNGACPICLHNGRCQLQMALQDALREKEKNEELELVIYTCPRFKEKF